jgi:hypothetical protein
MSIVDRFNAFAADFESCVADDNWARLEEYFVADASYWNVGGPDPKITGRAAILDYLRDNVASTDRRFESRNLEAITDPAVAGNKLSRKWRVTYTLQGAPDLVLEGEARYEFEGKLIRSLEEEATPASLQKYMEWMQKYGSKLHGNASNVG